MKKNKISKNWINKQKRDIYVRQSKVDGYRARSAYKLIEIDEKFKIFKGGMSVIDIGAAPGSWSQYASKKIKNGKVISIDLKKMEEIKNTIQIKGDFTEIDVQQKIKSFLNKKNRCNNVRYGCEYYRNKRYRLQSYLHFLLKWLQLFYIHLVQHLPQHPLVISVFLLF